MIILYLLLASCPEGYIEALVSNNGTTVSYCLDSASYTTVLHIIGLLGVVLALVYVLSIFLNL